MRDHLPTFITAANVELDALGEDPVAVIADTTAQIEVGDHRDYEPLVYPSIRLSFPQTRFVPFESGNNVDAENTRLIGLYLERTAGAGECPGDLVKLLHNDALVYLESIRAAIEKHLPDDDGDGVNYGDRIDVIGYESIEDDTPQDAEYPCVLRIKYEMTLEWWMRVRHSRNAP
ncbi:MAG: hypothetical protein GY778_16045 [bacterium]|nr:hypothetical protein [bacterium]